MMFTCSPSSPPGFLTTKWFETSHPDTLRAHLRYGQVVLYCPSSSGIILVSLNFAADYAKVPGP